MQADPQLGILQTVPMLIGHWSLFSRIQQFAGRVYGSLIARGMAAWSGNDGNYWGHNAIIRVAAFAQACGLPQLPGRKPFGGHVLSHDFVEAALMRRAGWKVRMAPDLGGSWEESPPSLVDIAIRDRRWAQGNLQHSKIIGAKGLAVTSRAHFVHRHHELPVLAAVADAAARRLRADPAGDADPARVFQPQLPAVPGLAAVRRAAHDRAVHLHDGRAVHAEDARPAAHACSPRARAAAAAASSRVTLGAVVETILSALYAPIMMLVQTQHIIEILTGRDSGWNAQRRHAHMTTWSEAWNFHWPHLVIGIVIGVIAFLISPTLFALAHADARRPAARGAAVEDQRQRQARPLARLVPRAAHAGREARAAGDPATR